MMMHRLAFNFPGAGIRARLSGNELLANTNRRFLSSHHQHQHQYSTSSHCSRPQSGSRPKQQACHFSRLKSFGAISAATLESPSSKIHHHHHHYYPKPRCFLTSTSDFTEELESELAKDNAAKPQSPLPVPPITPSNVSATSLISFSTVESLKSLPECQSVLDLLNNASTSTSTGTSDSFVSIEPSRVKEAHSNLQRARDILQSMPDLQRATYLLEVDLLSFCGKFELALESLARYKHFNGTAGLDKNEQKLLQFLKSKLLVHSGQFNHALSEYEFMLEEMEAEVEEQMRKMQEQMEQEEDVEVKVEVEDEVGEPLPVIHGAAALTGVGLTKLLTYVRENHVDGDADNHATTATKSEIMESIETAVDMLLESREEALLSPTHFKLAVDLGVTASIALTNAGVAQYLLYKDSNHSIEYWKKGLETLDAILNDSVLSGIIIRNYEMQCMESIRARLYCNISWALLEGEGGKDGLSDETLKDASEAAKMALDIYDELINGAKILRDDGIKDDQDIDDSGDSSKKTEEDAAITEELERIMKEQANAQEEVNGSDEPPSSIKPRDMPLSYLWIAYHRAESARALGLVARCYASAGAAVTAEGLFQSALDASSSYPLGQNINNRNDSGGKGVSLSSPNLGLIARDVRLGYAQLCDNWEKRKGDADRLRLDAAKIEDDGVLRGFVKGDGKDGKSATISGLESSLWLFSPLDFER